MQPGNPNNQNDDPYGQPTVREFQYPPPPPPKRPWYKRTWTWYRTKSRRTQIIIAAVIILFIAFGGIISALTPQTPSQNTTAASTQQATPTDTPTPDANAGVPVSTATVAGACGSNCGVTQAPTQVPTKAPTQPPPPKPTPTPACQAVNNNPWCYNFSPGNLIYTPPDGFCGYFNCIQTFVAPDDPGDGYVVECNDGTFSQSGGERGACSDHGGVMRALYSH